MEPEEKADSDTDKEPDRFAAESQGGDDEENSSDNNSDDLEYMTQADLERALESLSENKLNKILEEHFSSIETLLKKFPQTKKRKKDGSYTDEFKQQVKKIVTAYEELSVYPVREMRKSQVRAGEILVDSGSADVICDTIVDELESKNNLSKDPDIQTVSCNVLQNAVLIIGNFSDHNDAVVVKVREHLHLLPKIMEKLKEWQRPHLDRPPESVCCGAELSSFFTVIHNVGLHDDSIIRLRELKAIQILKPYLKSSDEHIRMITTATLANVMTDEQAELFSTESDLLETIILLLRRSLDHPKHTYGGWRITEIVRAIRQLARNDENKRTLVEKGVLPLLTECLSSELEREKEVCLEAILVLSFHEDNSNYMARDEELMDRVVELCHDKSDDNKECRHTAESLLWQLRHQLEKTERYRETIKAFLDSTQTRKTETSGQSARGDPATASEALGHVMLSYSWAQQAVVKTLYTYLSDHGLKVWMDIYEIEGSTRQAMADAVEKATVFLCCFSRQYKDSPNCRQEIEYACDCNKPIIPLKMQDYKSDGWLGLILSGKLFYDFSGKFDFNQKFQELLRAVQKQFVSPGEEGPATQKSSQKGVHAEGRDDVDGPIVAKSSEIMVTAPSLPEGLPPTSSVTPREMERVRSWSQADVRTWLSTYGVGGNPLDRLSGEDVALLCSLRKQNPQFYERTIKDRFQAHVLQETLQLGKALDDLMGGTPVQGQTRVDGHTQSKTCTVL